MISESLMINTTLTELNLYSDYNIINIIIIKKKDMNKYNIIIIKRNNEI